MQIHGHKLAVFKPCFFVGPELGPLAGLMIGPEQGGWQVDEITVVSSRTGHVDRWVSQSLLELPCIHDTAHTHGVTASREVNAVIAASRCAGYVGCLRHQSKHEMLLLQVSMSAAAGLQSRQERRVPCACAFRVSRVWLRGDSSSPVQGTLCSRPS